MNISGQNQDVQGDLYEYLLSRLNTAGTNGQFRTPASHHPHDGQDARPQARRARRATRPPAPADSSSTPGNTSWRRTPTRDDLTYDDDGWPHGLTGSRLTREEWEFAQNAGLHRLRQRLRHDHAPHRQHEPHAARPHRRPASTTPTRSPKRFNEERAYDVVLANPPFKGAIDASDVNPTLPTKVKKTEILFLHLFLRLLENGGRAAVIVPDGVLFGSSNAHVEVRRKLIEENRLDGVVSMPAGVFRPYAGVSTAVLLFTKGAATERIWFYDMEHDGFSLDDKRQRVARERHPRLACLLAAAVRRRLF